MCGGVLRQLPSWVSTTVTMFHSENPTALFLATVTLTLVVSLMLKKGKVRMVKDWLKDFALNFFANTTSSIVVAA